MVFLRQSTINNQSSGSSWAAVNGRAGFFVTSWWISAVVGDQHSALSTLRIGINSVGSDRSIEGRNDLLRKQLETANPSLAIVPVVGGQHQAFEWPNGLTQP